MRLQGGLEEMTSPMAMIANQAATHPYPGIRPFLQAEQARYFGRSAESVALAGSWRHNQLTYITGPAGRGKTSLLHAGVLPLLAGQGLDILPTGLLSCDATFPSAMFPEHNPYTISLLRSWMSCEIAPRIDRAAIREFVRQRRGSDIIFATIDQADELLAETSLRRTYRRQFLHELKDVMENEPRLHLLIVGREEAADIVANTLGNGTRYNVPALSQQSAIDALTLALRGTGRSLTHDAATGLVADLRTSRISARDGTQRHVTDDRVEPVLLQIACTWLWAKLPSNVVRISTGDVRKYCDVDAALAAYAGQVIMRVADDHALPAARLLAWLLDTFVTEQGTRNTAHESAATSAGMPESVARALEDRHLLVSMPQAGSRWYELLHERLIEPLRHAISTQPSKLKPTELLSAAKHAATIGELDLAERYAREILDVSPGAGLRRSAQVCSLLGNIAHEREKLETAEIHYREAAQRYAASGDSRSVAYQLAGIARTLLARGKAAEAAEELYAAIMRQPNDPVLLTEFAEALWQDGRGATAITVLDGALRMDGSYPAALRAREAILARHPAQPPK
jgi:tetratricopeptide (TPR) repeat protein